MITYQQLAQQTSAPASPELVERIKNPKTLGSLRDAMLNFSLDGVRLDAFKKHIFYGKKIDETTFEESKAGRFIRTEQNIKVIHGIIGICTEAAELAEALMKFLDGTKLDEVNLFEECGDVLWYIAELLTGLDSNFDSCMKANIRKLSLRYPDKFTEFHAENRDLEKERATFVNEK